MEQGRRSAAAGNQPLRSRIEASGLRKSFQLAHGALHAVADVSLCAAAGEAIAIVGPSGCGKSTVLGMLAGLVQPTSGGAYLDGEPLTGPVRSIGIMFQKPVLLPWRNVEQNLLLPAEIAGGDFAAHRRKVNAAIATVGLADFRRAYPRQLSGGMQQRVALARALAYEPRVLLMDEPFAALDEFTREAMNLELMRATQSAGITLILVTHSIAEAVLLADRVAVMTPRPGRLQAVVPVDLTRPRTIATMHTPRFAELALVVRQHMESAR